MTAYEIITQKRDGKALTRDEISFFIQDYLSGNIPDYQMSALLMAIYFNGMSDDELFALTESYLNSGEVLDLSDIPGFKIELQETVNVKLK